MYKTKLLGFSIKESAGDQCLKANWLPGRKGHESWRLGVTAASVSDLETQCSPSPLARLPVGLGSHLKIRNWNLVFKVGGVTAAELQEL